MKVRTTSPILVRGANGALREPTEAERQAILAVEGGDSDSFFLPALPAFIIERAGLTIYGGYLGATAYIAVHGFSDYQAANWGGFMISMGSGAISGFASYAPGKSMVIVTNAAFLWALGVAQNWIDDHHRPHNIDDGSNNR